VIVSVAGAKDDGVAGGRSADLTAQRPVAGNTMP